MSEGRRAAARLAPIWRLVNALRAVGADTGLDDLRDVLWLAEQLPRQGPRREAQRRGAAAALAERADTNKASATPPPPPAIGSAGGHSDRGTRAVRQSDTSEAPGAALYAGSSNGAGTAARRLRLPAPHPLPDALAIGRALLPVTRRRLRGPAVLLDEEATAEAIAHTGLTAAVMRQRRERWFSLLLAVDAAPSMLAWRARIDEFEQLLRRAGFRDLRRVLLHSGGTADPQPAALHTRAGTSLAPGGEDPGSAGAGELLLIVSDAGAAGWHDGRVSALLQGWLRALPVALVQPLPAPLWPHTAVGFAELRVAGTTPGQPGEQLLQRRPGWARGEPGPVLPVLALRADDVAQWARMVMAAGNAWCRAALLPLAEEAAVTPATPATPPPSPSATQLLEAFRAAATPDALELAAAFAVIRPLNLPVMRLIQAVMLPEVGNDALAQVLLSGLLQPLSEGPAVADDDAHTGYEIDDTLRDELASHLRRSRWLQVNLAVQRFVEIETGVGFDFIAFIEDRLGLDQVAPSAMPFAQLAARMAERFVPGRQGGAAGHRTVNERVFGPGLTIQAETRLTSPIRRLAWSPSGRSLAVLHAVGAEVLSRKTLAVQRRERLGPAVLLWAVKPAELDLLRPLMDAVRDAMETEWKRPCVNRHVGRIASMGDVPEAALRVLPVTAAWARSDLNELFHPGLKEHKVQVLVLRPGRFQLALTGRLSGADWRGALDRPVGSAATRALVEALVAEPSEDIMFQTLRGPGSVDAVAWPRSEADERLHVVGREHLLPNAETSVYVEGGLVRDLQLPKPEDCVVAEYAPDTESVLWQRGDEAWIRLGEVEIGALQLGRPRATRFAPDERNLAVLSERGELEFMPVRPESSASR